MNKKDIKTRIKRHLKRGTFMNVSVTKAQLTATFNALKTNSPFTYVEKHSNGMIVLDTVKNRLTIYTLK